MDEIKEKINFIIREGEEINDELLKEIDNLSNEDERKEVVEYLINAKKEALLITSWENEEVLEENIAEFKNKLNSLTNISNEEINAILINNGFELKNIYENSIVKKAAENSEKTEIVKINEQIDELRKKMIDYPTAEEIEEEIKTLENEKSNFMKDLNEQIDAIELELSKRDDTELKELEAELEKLKEERNELSHSSDGSADETDTELEDLNEQIDNIRAQINDIKEHSAYFSMNDEELDNKIEELLSKELKDGKNLSSEQMAKLRSEIDNLEAEQQRRMQNNKIKELEEKAANLDKEEFIKKAEKMNLRDPHGKDYMEKVAEVLYQKELEQIHDEINKIKNSTSSYKTVNELESKLNDLISERDNLLTKKSDKKLASDSRKEELDNLIKELEDKINAKKSGVSNSTTDLENKISELKEKQSNLWNDVVHHGGEASEEEQKKLDELNKEIKELEDKLNRIKTLNAKNNDELKNELEVLKQKRKEIQSKYDTQISNNKKKLDDYKTLNYYTNIRDAYNQIRYQCELEYENKELDDDTLKSNINSFVDNHELCKDINKYPNAEKMKNELKDELFNNLKSKQIVKTKDEKTYTKVIAAIAGFGLGFGLSMVPGVGTVRMIASTAKLASSAIKCWTNKHPEGKVASIMNNINNKLNEKFPRLMNGIKATKEKLKQYPINTFINGMAAGYITGNIVENIYGSIPKVDAEGIVEPKPPVDPLETINEIDSGDIELNPGDVVDISDIEYGLVSPDSTDYHHLLTSVGDDAVVDKFTVIGDKTMVHFKQSNGLGYAWFDLEDVKQVLAENTKEELMNKIAYEQLTNLDSTLANVSEATAEAVKSGLRR